MTTKHRPAVSDENYEFVSAFDGGSFNEQMKSLADAYASKCEQIEQLNVSRGMLQDSLRESRERCDVIDKRCDQLKAEAQYSDNRLKAALKEFAQLQCKNSELNRKNKAADEHIVELNEKISELECFRDWLHVERKKSKELGDKYTHARLLYDDASAELLSTCAQLREAQSERDRHEARAARYKFTTAVYGVCAVVCLIGWIYL